MTNLLIDNNIIFNFSYNVSFYIGIPTRIFIIIQSLRISSKILNLYKYDLFRFKLKNDRSVEQLLRS